MDRTSAQPKVNPSLLRSTYSKFEPLVQDWLDPQMPKIAALSNLAGEEREKRGGLIYDKSCKGHALPLL
jgi:hypothetical protein